MIQAKNLMTADPIVIQTNDDPTQILKVFLVRKLTALPVGDQKGDIVGILTEMNLVKIMVQHSIDGKGKKIGNYVSHFEKPAFVNDTDELGAIVRAMVGSTTHRVLVRNKAEKVIGVVSPKDLLKVLAGNT